MDVVTEPTAQDVILADTQRWQQAGLIAVCEVGPEPDQGTLFWDWWHARVIEAAEAAFGRLN